MKYNQKLLKKMMRPIHIDYISESFFKSDMVETRKEINQMIDDDMIEESKYGKDYYVLKNKNNE